MEDDRVPELRRQRAFSTGFIKLPAIGLLTPTSTPWQNDVDGQRTLRDNSESQRTLRDNSQSAAVGSTQRILTNYQDKDGTLLSKATSSSSALSEATSSPSPLSEATSYAPLSSSVTETSGTSNIRNDVDESEVPLLSENESESSTDETMAKEFTPRGTNLNTGATVAMPGHRPLSRSVLGGDGKAESGVRQGRQRSSSAIAVEAPRIPIGVAAAPSVVAMAAEPRRRAHSVVLSPAGDGAARRIAAPLWKRAQGEEREDGPMNIPEKAMESSREVADHVIVVDAQAGVLNRGSLAPSSSGPIINVKGRGFSAADSIAEELINGGFVYHHLTPVQMTTSLSPESHWVIMIFLLIVLYLSLIMYLTWKVQLFIRLSESLTYSAVMFLCMEAALSVLPFVDLLDYIKPEMDRPDLRLAQSGPFPSAVILITCCCEQLDVIQDVVRAALCQDYPAEKYAVWVLDDGGDEQLLAWCDALMKSTAQNLGYIRRERKPGVKDHAKAGNLNHALSLCTSEFVAVVDADMIVSRSFLTHSIAQFTSLNIAFVQSPQGFYNIPPGDPHNDSSLSFYHCSLSRRDAWGAAMCIGTGTVFRRTALEEVGNFSIGTLTEDFDTALRLHSRGYDSVYLIRHLQMGLAPWTLARFIKQRQRWCMGGVQIILKRRILFHPHRCFSLYRRIMYFSSGSKWLWSFATAYMQFVVIFILAFDLPLVPTAANAEEMRMYVKLIVPCVISYRLISYARLWRIPGALVRAQTRLRDEQLNCWMAPYFCIAILRVLFPFIPKEFDVTGSALGNPVEGKSPCMLDQRALKNVNLVLYHLVLIIVSLSVLAWKIVNLDLGHCGQVILVSNFGLYVLYSAQNLAMPIYCILFPPHLKPSDRKSLLSYDANGVPEFRVQFPPPTSYAVLLNDVVPLAWSILWAYFVYVAFTPDYRPAFCTTKHFFEWQL